MGRTRSTTGGMTKEYKLSAVKPLRKRYRKPRCVGNDVLQRVLRKQCVYWIQVARFYKPSSSL